MFKPIFFSLAALVASFGTSATADYYSVHLEDGAFFPEITYVALGDTVRFVNNTSNSLEAVASDNSWTTGVLTADASYHLTVESATTLSFAYASDSAKTGVLTFDLPLLIDDLDDENADSANYVDVSTD